jgi:hypothetical protein
MARHGVSETRKQAASDWFRAGYRTCAVRDGSTGEEGAVSFMRRIRERASEIQQDRAEIRAARDAQEAEEQQRRAEEQAEADRQAELRYAEEVFGAELANLDTNTPEEAKYAIKLARLRKRELQAEKKELAAELADERERWRGRQAGRISTVGLGRGTGGRMMRAGVQAKRRGERLEHAGLVNEFSDARQELDRPIALVDRLIIDLEREATRR